MKKTSIIALLVAGLFAGSRSAARRAGSTGSRAITTAIIRHRHAIIRCRRGLRPGRPRPRPIRRRSGTPIRGA